MILYYKPTCPYCQKVLAFAGQQNIIFDLRNIDADATAAEELIAKGGKQQVPYLIDESKGVAMYGSDDIVTYLAHNYID